MFFAESKHSKISDEGLVMGMAGFGMTFGEIEDAFRQFRTPHEMRGFGSMMVGLVNDECLAFDDEGRSLLLESLGTQAHASLAA